MLSDQIRVGLDSTPWVHQEVKRLEARLAEAERVLREIQQSKNYLWQANWISDYFRTATNASAAPENEGETCFGCGIRDGHATGCLD